MTPIGIGGPQGGGDNGGEFESYRQKRQNRRFKQASAATKMSPETDAKTKLHRAIEEEERREMVERQLAREVQEFVEETTRLAASILNQVSSQEEEHHRQQIAREMKEFFQATLHRAESMLGSLKSMEERGASVADLEATLTNLTTRTMDEFRAEGSESLRDKHIGEDAHLTSLEHAADPEVPVTGAISLIGKEEGWHEINEEDVDSGLAEEISDAVFESDGSCSMEPLGEDFEFIDDSEDDSQVSGAWRAAADPEQDPDSPVEEITVETEFAADFVDDSEEDALAADPISHGQEGESASVEPKPQSQDATGPATPDFPPFFEKWRHDKAALKKALTVMVKNGLMAPDEARKIFAQV